MANIVVLLGMITVKSRTNVQSPSIVSVSKNFHNLDMFIVLLLYVMFTIKGQPKIRKSLTDIEIAEKETLLLEVEIYAVPEAKISWFRDGKEVTSDARIKIHRDSQRSETYNLTLNLIKREEAGVYEVKAINTCGSAVSKSVVTVNSKSNISQKYFSLMMKLFNEDNIKYST